MLSQIIFKLCDQETHTYTHRLGPNQGLPTSLWNFSYFIKPETFPFVYLEI